MRHTSQPSLIQKQDEPRQFRNKDGTLAILPVDVALLADPQFRESVEMYAADEKIFFEDFAYAFGKVCSVLYCVLYYILSVLPIYFVFFFIRNACFMMGCCVQLINNGVEAQTVKRGYITRVLGF
jgi:hypothetical protein